MGYVVYRGPSELNGAPIVGILTLGSANTKTGDMSQLWILPADEAPHHAQRSGADEAVCGDCPFRPLLAKPAGRPVCYVKTFQGPRSTWEAHKGQPVRLREAQGALRAHGGGLRLGAYGDPAALPEDVVSLLVDASEFNTGYTHQWRKHRFRWLQRYAMASCDSPADYARAKAEGWRTFRVLPRLPMLQERDSAAVASQSQARADNEIVCPSDRVQCKDCGLCDGIQYSPDRRKDIAIVAH